MEPRGRKPTKGHQRGEEKPATVVHCLVGEHVVARRRKRNAAHNHPKRNNPDANPQQKVPTVKKKKESGGRRLSTPILGKKTQRWKEKDSSCLKTDKGGRAPFRESWRRWGERVEKVGFQPAARKKGKKSAKSPAFRDEQRRGPEATGREFIPKGECIPSVPASSREVQRIRAERGQDNHFHFRETRQKKERPE